MAVPRRAERRGLNSIIEHSIDGIAQRTIYELVPGMVRNELQPGDAGERQLAA